MGLDALLAQVGGGDDEEEKKPKTGPKPKKSNLKPTPNEETEPQGSCMHRCAQRMRSCCRRGHVVDQPKSASPEIILKRVKIKHVSLEVVSSLGVQMGLPGTHFVIG